MDMLVETFHSKEQAEKSRKENQVIVKSDNLGYIILDIKTYQLIQRLNPQANFKCE